MKTTILSACLMAFILFSGCSSQTTPRSPFSVDELMIQVFDTSREVAYTNKEAGYFYTETNAPHRTSWQGWHIMSAKMLDDYRITVGDKALDRRDVQITQVFPHQFIRTYKIGLRERVTMLDSVNAIVVELDRVKGKRLSVVPLFSQPDAEIARQADGAMLLAAARHHMQRTEKENFPVWTGMTVLGGSPAADTTYRKVDQYSGIGRIQTDVQDEKATIIFTAGDDVASTERLSALVASSYPAMIQARKARMEKLLNDSYLRTNDEQLTKALNWAKISMDALLMNQVKKGIFAGLPWFDNYWGRDSYISLPGAALVTGKFAEAKEILRSFAEWQDHDFESPTAGRIPNLVTTVSMAYNTTDGTPWFVNALDLYVKSSGDTAFAREMYPTVFMAIEGALKHHVDSLSLMTHADAETWMDAVGPNGPWSPRGNRANDIQALWYREMQVAIALAQFAGDYEAAARWNGIIRNIQYNFNKYYVDRQSGSVYDHLNIDGSPDRQIRPNQLFAIPILDNEQLKAAVFKNVTEKLVYPWGIASLWQEDENFHPYHHYSPYYVQDAAYHNGTVWTWLYGRWVDAATSFHQQNVAYEVTKNMAHQILDRGAVGTLSELTDALPRPGTKEPQLSGTFSQAWSLAEYVRSFYQGYLGCTVDATVPRITLAPSLPEAITNVRFTIPIGSSSVDAEYQLAHGTGEVRLASPAGARAIDLRLRLLMADGAVHTISTTLNGGVPLVLKIGADKVTETSPAGTHDLDAGLREQPVPATFFNGIHLATPHLRDDLAALKGPNYPVLHGPEVTKRGTGATVITDVRDPAGDDRGATGTYVYPVNTNLKAGSLDITRFTVATDDSNAYFRLTFRDLSNPGWHPEYGFQLTYAAIAIDKDGKAGSGSTEVGMNSLYRLDPAFAFEDIIYVGGGFTVQDLKGKILAQYLPAPEDVRNTFGNVEMKSVSFAIPVSIIGKPTSAWRYTVLIGAQDDHGGAGVGDFRGVEREAKEWNGGGKKNASDPNIYDVLTADGKK